MTRPSVDSKVVDAELRRVLWPELKAIGFRRTGRTAWRDRPDCIEVVNVQSFNSYLADAIEATSFSFAVNLGVFYPVIAEHSVLGPYVKDAYRPAEYVCHARCHLAKGISQRPAAVDRPQVWYVEPDTSNLGPVVADARDRVMIDGLPWLDRLSDLVEARRAFLDDESTNVTPGRAGEDYGGAIGSPARWEAATALSIAIGDTAVTGGASPERRPIRR
jgi:hypothetical protein